MFVFGGFGFFVCFVGKFFSFFCFLWFFLVFRLGGMILNMDEFWVMDLKLLLVVIIDFFFFFIIRGFGLKGVFNLFFFGCFISIVFFGLILFGFVFSFEFVYVLIFDFCFVFFFVIIFWVFCKVCCLVGVGDIFGRVVLSFFLFSVLFGDIFVVVCGVVWYCLRNLYSFCF